MTCRLGGRGGTTNNEEEEIEKYDRRKNNEKGYFPHSKKSISGETGVRYGNEITITKKRRYIRQRERKKLLLWRPQNTTSKIIY